MKSTLLRASYTETIVVAVKLLKTVQNSTLRRTIGLWIDGRFSERFSAFSFSPREEKFTIGSGTLLGSVFGGEPGKGHMT